MLGGGRPLELGLLEFRAVRDIVRHFLNSGELLYLAGGNLKDVLTLKDGMWLAIGLYQQCRDDTC
jgi:hypothetical protein